MIKYKIPTQRLNGNHTLQTCLSVPVELFIELSVSHRIIKHALQSVPNTKQR